MRRLLLFSLIFFLSATPAYAKYNPLILPNNKIGIHILNEADIEEAANLVNSSGGDWGYVTLVIRDDERDINRWNNFFQQLKNNHLIPIVRIATHAESGAWVRPQKEEAHKWSAFLNNLNWPTENRYVIIFNEPNHAKEWGGGVDPENYAKTLNNYIKVLNLTNPDFFILPAGLDLAAPTGKNAINAYTFMQLMNKAVPGIFSKLDGWTSHSYPNPGFSGSPYDNGKMSVRGFEWELKVLSGEFGVEKRLPVFITETGWAKSSKLSSSLVAKYYSIALSQAWTNSQIVAITPFLLRYDDPPFSPFAFIVPKAQAAYYPQYTTIQNLPKTRARPLGTSSTPLGKLLDKIILRRSTP
jgi:hypothetical protein